MELQWLRMISSIRGQGKALAFSLDGQVIAMFFKDTTLIILSTVDGSLIQSYEYDKVDSI